MRVVGGPLRRDPGELLADRGERELPGRALRGVAGGPEPHRPGPDGLQVERAGTGRVLVDGAQDGGDDQQRRGRVPVADGVEEPVHRGAEGAQPHEVGVDHVDADLDADQVGRGVPHGAGGERVEQRAPAQSEVDQLDTAERGGQRGPGRAGARGVGTVADRAAVVQPHPAAPVRHGLDRRVRAQPDQLGALVVRQPDRDVLGVGGEAGEPQRVHGPRPGLDGSGRHVHGPRVTTRRTGLGDQSAVDEQVVDPGRARRETEEVHRGPEHVQLDRGRAGAEGEPHTRGLGLRGGQLRVGALRAGCLCV